MLLASGCIDLDKLADRVDMSATHMSDMPAVGFDSAGVDGVDSGELDAFAAGPCVPEGGLANTFAEQASATQPVSIAIANSGYWLAMLDTSSVIHTAVYTPPSSFTEVSEQISSPTVLRLSKWTSTAQSLFASHSSTGQNYDIVDTFTPAASRSADKTVICGGVVFSTDIAAWQTQWLSSCLYETTVELNGPTAAAFPVDPHVNEAVLAFGADSETGFLVVSSRNTGDGILTYAEDVSTPTASAAKRLTTTPLSNIAADIIGSPPPETFALVVAGITQGNLRVIWSTGASTKEMTVGAATVGPTGVAGGLGSFVVVYEVDNTVRGVLIDAQSGTSSQSFLIASAAHRPQVAAHQDKRFVVTYVTDDATAAIVSMTCP